MSFTEAQTLFGGVHEAGINDFLRAFLTARPRYINYGTPFFVAATTVSETSIPAIAFPGVPGGIEFRVGFSIPTVDLSPDSSSGSSPLPPGPQQFTLKTTVTLTVGCRSTPRGLPGGQDSGRLVPLEMGLEVLARGSIIITGGRVGLLVSQVELVDVTPDALESILECIIRMLLQAALLNVTIPLNALVAAAVPLLSIVRGPEIATDQVKLWGVV